MNTAPKDNPLWYAFLAYQTRTSAAPPDPSDPGDWLEWLNFKAGAAAYREACHLHIEPALLNHTPSQVCDLLYDIEKSIPSLIAFKDQAEGNGHEGCAIRCDAALAREFDWIKTTLNTCHDVILWQNPQPGDVNGQAHLQAVRDAVASLSKHRRGQDVLSNLLRLLPLLHGLDSDGTKAFRTLVNLGTSILNGTVYSEVKGAVSTV